MNIKDQTTTASAFTEKLLNYIIKSNNQLNSDGSGCYVDSINLMYLPEKTVLSVKFKSSNKVDSPVTEFTCCVEKY